MQGTQGLSLFYLETKDEQGWYNNLEIQCLKNKLGTRQLPTAELLLDGTEARLVGKEGRGVACISPMLTITRIHNGIAAVSGMRRILQLARDYSTRRVAFGKYIADHPLPPYISARKHFSLTHSSQSADVDEHQDAIPITRTTIHTLERVVGMSLYV